jgi:hypothetical protein
MTSVASRAAGARAETTEYSINVRLTPNDLKMIRAFKAWDVDHTTCSPKKDQIERGYGEHTFMHIAPRSNGCGGYKMKLDTTGPHTFRRLVAIGVIEHSRNGHCWLTAAGKAIAKDLE